MRRTVTMLLVIVGLALMVVGYTSAAPWGGFDSDPTIVGAPLIFLLGIVSVVSAAVLYELLPDRRR